MNKAFSAALLLACFSLVPVLAWGETAEIYTLSGVPGLQEAASNTNSGQFADLVNTVYRIAIGLGSLAAVLVLVVEGLRYSASDSPSAKSRLKGRMTMALGGLALLIAAYLLIEIVDPNINNFNLDTEEYEQLKYTTEIEEPDAIDAKETDSGKGLPQEGDELKEEKEEKEKTD